MKKALLLFLTVSFTLIFAFNLSAQEAKLGKLIFEDGKYPQAVGNTGLISFYQFTDDLGNVNLRLVTADPKTGKIEPVDLEFEDSPPMGSIAWSKDGENMAHVRKDYTVCDIYSMPRGNPDSLIKLTDLTEYIPEMDTARMNLYKLEEKMLLNAAYLEWSYDNEKMIFTLLRVVDAGMYMLDIPTGRTRQIVPKKMMAGSPSWAPDNETLYFGGKDPSGERSNPDIYKFTVSDYSVEPVLNSPASELYPEVSHDGKYLVYTKMAPGERQTVYVYDIENDRSAQLVYLGKKGAASFPMWSADGKSVVYQLIVPGNTYPDLYQIDFDPSIFDK
ncbi:MAG: hypothetical protein GF310_08805 [candidate division Zixibacteria bacterium]|nr:hypothetical protein [candidate division Zixibacteria bacterium]